VQILLWLVPPMVVTLIVMVWVSRDIRLTDRHLDPEEAVARLGEALARDPRVPHPVPRPRARVSGVVVRPSGLNGSAN
jgi:hypothetical protein